MSAEMDVDAPLEVSKPDTVTNKPERPSVIVTKPIPYTFDLGNLLVNDLNPLPAQPTAADITAASRDCAQALINQLLSTCPIRTASGSGSGGDLVLELPAPTIELPREKSLPQAREETKWERFAKKRGIKPKRRDERPATVAADGDESGDGERTPRYGYTGRASARRKAAGGVADDWLVEVDEKKEREAEEAGRSVRGMARAERKEAARRNERKQRANERRQREKGA